MIRIHWNDKEFLIDESQIRWVSKIKRGDAGKSMLVSFGPTDADLEFKENDGDVEQLFKVIHSAMKEKRNQFVYSGKEDKDHGA